MLNDNEKTIEIIIAAIKKVGELLELYNNPPVINPVILAKLLILLVTLYTVPL
jgi:hypothetical protein